MYLYFKIFFFFHHQKLCLITSIQPAKITTVKSTKYNHIAQLDLYNQQLISSFWSC